jgi:S1-C subfamily serine protease
MRRFIRSTFLFLVLAGASGFVGILVFLVLLPRLASSPVLSQWSALRTFTENVTVIEKTEQVVISQDEAIERFLGTPFSSIVGIVSTSSGAPAVRQTGVLVTNDGVVATYRTAAPLSANERHTVFFADGNASPARFIWFDTRTNVAYYQTDRRDTPSIAFANSDDIRPGRRFVALASTADERQGQLAVGVIAAADRMFNLSGKTVASSDKWEGVLLPDRPLDDVFVGGAAVALNGEMIGLTGLLDIDGEKRVFFLPANALRQSLQRYISEGTRLNRSFGVYYVTVSKETALLYGLGRDRGALVYTPSGRNGLAIIAGSPAEEMGLRVGDLIIGVNGREINLDWPLSVALAATSPGTDLTFQIVRNEEERELRMVW